MELTLTNQLFKLVSVLTMNTPTMFVGDCILAGELCTWRTGRDIATMFAT